MGGGRGDRNPVRSKIGHRSLRCLSTFNSIPWRGSFDLRTGWRSWFSNLTKVIGSSFVSVIFYHGKWNWHISIPWWISENKWNHVAKSFHSFFWGPFLYISPPSPPPAEGGRALFFGTSCFCCVTLIIGPIISFDSKKKWTRRLFFGRGGRGLCFFVLGQHLTRVGW